MAQITYDSITDYDFDSRGMPSCLKSACKSFCDGAFAFYAGYARRWYAIGKPYPNRVKRKNMTNLLLCITSNIDLKTFTFCTAGTIAQYAEKIGVDKSTVSRHLHDLIELGELEEAFPGKASSNDPKAGLVRKPNLVDDNGKELPNTGVYLPRVLRVTLKFFERRCPEGVVQDILQQHEKKLSESGLSLKEALLEVRDRVYQYAFKKHTERLSLKLGFRSSAALKRCKTRDEAIALIISQIKREYNLTEFQAMSESELNRLILRRLKASGWSKAPPG